MHIDTVVRELYSAIPLTQPLRDGHADRLVGLTDSGVLRQSNLGIVLILTGDGRLSGVLINYVIDRCFTAFGLAPFCKIQCRAPHMLT